MKHTTGPWAISGRTSTCIRTADQEQRIAYMETADNTIETCIANARLIAAAPDLLKALIDILSNHETAGAGASIFQTQQVEAARAAVARATSGGAE